MQEPCVCGEPCVSLSLQSPTGRFFYSIFIVIENTSLRILAFELQEYLETMKSKTNLHMRKPSPREIK